MSLYGPGGRLSRRFGVRGRPLTPERLSDGIECTRVLGRNKCVQARRLVGYSLERGPSATPELDRLLVVVVLGQVTIYLSATLLLWVLSGPVLKHGPRSLTCARVIGTASLKA